MDVETAAKALDGCEYRNEGSRELFAEMKSAGLVAVFGYSDDNVELRGAIYDELPAWDGTTIYLTEHGLVTNECDNGGCPYFEQALKQAQTIDAVWAPEGESVSWAYMTTIPHATFNVMEDGEVYCRGIVFRLSDAGLVTVKGGR